MKVAALFGPTGVGKTAIAIALARRLRAAGEDPVAVNCDSIQVYKGLGRASAAPTPAEREQLEHRLVGFVPAGQEFSAGRFAGLARDEIDGLLDEGRRPIVIGGTGLYLQAALSDLALKPPVPEGVRAQVEAEIEKRGSKAVHAELEIEAQRRIHPNDRKRIARALELAHVGEEAHDRTQSLWTARLRHPTLLTGLVMDRAMLAQRIEQRVDEMFETGAAEEIAGARQLGLSRTAAALLGLEGFLAGDREVVATAHRRYARRQMTWMRKMPGVTVVDRTGLDEETVAARLEQLLVG